MFQFSSKSFHRLAFHHITRQGVPQPRACRTEWPVTDRHETRPWNVQLVRCRWSQTSSAGHVGDASQVIRKVARSQSAQGPERQRRQLELNALGRTQPVQTGKRGCDVVRAPKSCDRTSCSVQYRLKLPTQLNRDSSQGCVAVVQPAQHKRDNQRLVHRRRDWPSYAAQFAQSREAPGHSPLDVWPHTQVSVEKDAEVADAGRRQNEVFNILYVALTWLNDARQRICQVCLHLTEN